MEKKPIKQPARPVSPASKPAPARPAGSKSSQSPCNESCSFVKLGKISSSNDIVKSYSTGPSGDKKK